jgi:hypothetical protein
MSRIRRMRSVTSIRRILREALPSRHTHGEGGIRTLGTRIGYNSLAGSPIQPLSHLSNFDSERCRLPSHRVPRRLIRTLQTVESSCSSATQHSIAADCRVAAFLVVSSERYRLSSHRVPRTSSSGTRLAGESGIRTHGTGEGTTVFKTASLNHSDISPVCAVLYRRRIALSTNVIYKCRP